MNNKIRNELQRGAVVGGKELARRDLIAGAGTLLAANAAPGRAAADSGDLQGLAEDAAIWGLPLVQTGRYLALARSRGLRMNQFYLNQALATPSLLIPAPNVDTLYGIAWLDLSAGPVVLDVLDAGDRYYSIHFMDAYENSFAYVGRRATGDRAGSYVIAPSGWSGSDLPPQAKRIDAPTGVVLLLARTLVAGPADLAAAQAVQAGYTLSPLAGYPARRAAGIVQPNALEALPKLDLGGSGGRYFGELDALVRQFPPRGQETVAFARFAPLGVGTGFPQQANLPPAALDGALENALRRVTKVNTAEDNDGWRVNYMISGFITDPLVRAGVNQLGPGANIAEEALYFTAAHDADGAPLDGSDRYSITFTKGQLPPVHAFWSLILYDADFHLYDNPADRYAVNDRTPGIEFAANGSLKIIIQHREPSNTANWLPAPRGAFRLMLRAYQPDATLLARQYRVPPILVEQ
jgi:hypothetical protein